MLPPVQPEALWLWARASSWKTNMCIEGRAVCLDGRWEEHGRRVHMGVRPPSVRPSVHPPTLVHYYNHYNKSFSLLAPSLKLVFPMVGQSVGRSRIAVLHDPGFFALNLTAQQNFRVIGSFQIPTWNVNYLHLLERCRFILLWIDGAESRGGEISLFLCLFLRRCHDRRSRRLRSWCRRPL